MRKRYDPRGLIESAYQGFDKRNRTFVWSNLPPAKVVTLTLAYSENRAHTMGDAP